MSALRKALAGSLALCLLSAPATADGRLAHDFADCAGRFSAAVEHAWLMQSPEADAHARARRSFVDLLEAIGAEGGEALNQRIAAKAAQASLLREASFGADDARSNWAERRANVQLATCRLLLLGG